MHCYAISLKGLDILIPITRYIAYLLYSSLLTWKMQSLSNMQN